MLIVKHQISRLRSIAFLVYGNGLLVRLTVRRTLQQELWYWR